MRQSELYGWRIKTSPLPTAFHVRDAIGSDVVEEFDRSVLLPGQPASVNLYVRASSKVKPKRK